MRKKVVTLLIACMTLSLVACSSNKKEDESVVNEIEVTADSTEAAGDEEKAEEVEVDNSNETSNETEKEDTETVEEDTETVETDSGTAANTDEPDMTEEITLDEAKEMGIEHNPPTIEDLKIPTDHIKMTTAGQGLKAYCESIDKNNVYFKMTPETESETAQNWEVLVENGTVYMSFTTTENESKTYKIKEDANSDTTSADEVSYMKPSLVMIDSIESSSYNSETGLDEVKCKIIPHEDDGRMTLVAEETVDGTVYYSYPEKRVVAIEYESEGEIVHIDIDKCDSLSKTSSDFANAEEITMESVFENMMNFTVNAITTE